MKLQQLIFKVEELKALVSLYEQTQQNLAQATAVMATIADEPEEEQKAKVAATMDQLQARITTIETLLAQRTGTFGIDSALDKVQEHIARLQQYQQYRGEQLQLRTQLDLELALGPVDLETRHKVEGSLAGFQNRMDVLVQQGEAALVTPRLVTL